MAHCDECGKEESMPYHCRHCGGTYCGEHRLPENHDCPGLDDWGDPGGVFDSGFDDSVSASSSSSSEGVAGRLGIDTGPGGTLAYFRGNMTYVFLGVMWVTFLLQNVILLNVGRDLHQTLFVIHPQNPEYVWTWVTSIFSHGGLYHIAGNSIVIFFFGRIVEKYIGSRDYTLLFIGSGVLAGLGQIGIMMLQGIDVGALGASGAALALTGVLTVLNPNLRVWIWGVFPAPIWGITAVFAIAASLGIFGVPTPFGGGNVADGAHLLGLAIGLTYGQKVKNKISTPGSLRFGGGGPGGPGGPGGRRRGPF